MCLFRYGIGYRTDTVVDDTLQGCLVKTLPYPECTQCNSASCTGMALSYSLTFLLHTILKGNE